MPDHAPFLAAIRAAPDDDAPRLIYADWLDEHGQPERAEFIHVQCELARRDSAALRQREAGLLAEHHDALAGPHGFPQLRFRFHRGFVSSFGHNGVYVCQARTSADHSQQWLQFFPDDSVRWLTSRRANRDPRWRPSDVILRYEGAYSIRLEAESLALDLYFEGEHEHEFIAALESETILVESRHLLSGQKYRETFHHNHLAGWDTSTNSPQDAV